jgi:hypothetical protein
LRASNGFVYFQAQRQRGNSCAVCNLTHFAF